MSTTMTRRPVRRRRILVTLGAAALALATAACGSSGGGSGAASGASAGGAGGSTSAGNGSASASGTVKVGLEIPLSGVYASIGTDMKQGFELYLTEHGNKLGGRTATLVTVDEGSGPQSGVPAARKLVQQNHVDVATGIVSSATAEAVKSVFDQAKTPVIYANGQPYPPGEASPSPYAWVDSFPTPPLTESMGQYLAKKYSGGKSVYFIAADYAAGHQLAGDTMKAFKAAGGQVAGQAFPPLGTTQDYQPYLSKIQQSGAAAVYCFFAGSDAARFVKQFSSFGLSGKIGLYADGALTAGSALTAEGSAAEGIVTNFQYSSQLDNPANKKFVSDYKAKYGSDPDVFALDQYDAALVIDKALSKVSGKVSNSAIVSALQNLGTLSTPRGSWHFDPKGQNPVQSIYLFKVEQQNGQLVNAVIDNLGVYSPVTGKRIS